MKYLLAAMIAMCIAFLCYVEFYPFPADVDPVNLASGQKNAYTFMGALTGITLVYILDEKKIHFSVSAVWWAQLLKIGGGLCVVLAVKEGLRIPLDSLFQGHLIARAIRYFLTVVVAGAVWPLSFPFFARLGNSGKQEDAA